MKSSTHPYIGGIMLNALTITPQGEIHKSIVNLKRLEGPLFVQPGLTPPSQVSSLSQAFLGTPGAKGCTGEAFAVASFCQAEGKFGYILSSKSIEELTAAYLENKEKADSEKRPNPFARLTLISDPDFVLAQVLGNDCIQSIDDTLYYRRFVLMLNKGQVTHIERHDFTKDPSPTPAALAQQLLQSQKQNALEPV